MILNKKLENYWLILLSLPSWECGLKFGKEVHYTIADTVTPFVGVWIEIDLWESSVSPMQVTPFVGVWIEIPYANYRHECYGGHSLRGSVD